VILCLVSQNHKYNRSERIVSYLFKPRNQRRLLFLGSVKWRYNIILILNKCSANENSPRIMEKNETRQFILRHILYFRLSNNAVQYSASRSCNIQPCTKYKIYFTVLYIIKYVLRTRRNSYITYISVSVYVV